MLRALSGRQRYAGRSVHRRPSLYKRIGSTCADIAGTTLERRAIAVATGVAVMVGLGCAILFGQGARDPDPARYAAESLQHFQALLRLNTSNPPGNEHLVTDYLKSALEKEGIPVRILALEQARPNLVARLKGRTKRPVLLMGHSDVVTVDEKKWTFPPFGATRDGGYIYGARSSRRQAKYCRRAHGDADAEAARSPARAGRDSSG